MRRRDFRGSIPPPPWSSSTPSFFLTLCVLLLGLALCVCPAQAAQQVQMQQKQKQQPRQLQSGISPSTSNGDSEAGNDPTLAPAPDTTPSPTTNTSTGGGSPTLAPTFSPTPSPTAAPTPHPPVYVSILFNLTVSFPQPPPPELQPAMWADNAQAQSVIKDALTLAVTVIKRGDIEQVQAVRLQRKLDLTIRVKTTTLLASTPYAEPLQLYNAFQRQIFAAKGDGTLNRYLQGAATTNGVEAFAQAYVKSYVVPNRYMVNGEVTSAIIPATDKVQVQRGVPLVVLIPSIIAALLMLGTMVVFSQQRALDFQAQYPQELLEVLAVTHDDDENNNTNGSSPGGEGGARPGGAGRGRPRPGV